MILWETVPIFWIFPKFKKHNIENQGGMAMTRRILTIVFVLCLGVLSAQAQKDESSLREMEDFYQHDADIFRLRHMKYYAELFQEFMDKTGRYPFQGKASPTLDVVIATEEQQVEVDKLTQQQNSTPPLGAEDLRKELEQGLGRKQRLWFDPQRVPSGRPIWYYYYVEGDCFYFTIHLYSSNNIANKAGDYHYILGISNCYDQHQRYWLIPDLLQNAEFIAACNTPPEKPGWMIHLEEINQ